MSAMPYVHEGEPEPNLSPDNTSGVAANLDGLNPGHPLRNPFSILPHVKAPLYREVDILLCAVLQPLPGIAASAGTARSVKLPAREPATCTFACCTCNRLPVLEFVTACMDCTVAKLYIEQHDMIDTKSSCDLRTIGIPRNGWGRCCILWRAWLYPDAQQEAYGLTWAVKACMP